MEFLIPLGRNIITMSDTVVKVPDTEKMQRLRQALYEAKLEYAIVSSHEDKMITINIWVGED